jgi:hypothetical protein
MCDECFSRCPHGTSSGYSWWYCRCNDCRSYRAPRREQINARGAVYYSLHKEEYAAWYAAFAVEPSVYVVLLPASGIAKVGETENTKAALSTAKKRAKLKGADASDAHIAWIEPGDYRHETYIQSHLAFSWRAPSWASGSRLSEWFVVNDNSDIFIAEVKAIYSATPEDKVA